MKLALIALLLLPAFAQAQRGRPQSRDSVSENQRQPATDVPDTFLPANLRWLKGVPFAANMPGTSAVQIRPPRIATAPTIDGRVDESVWRRAAKLTGFVQVEPGDPQAATHNTTAYVYYDADHLYLAMVAEDSAENVRGTIYPRERGGGDREDRFSVHLDTYNDQRRAYVFSVSARGIQFDGVKPEGGGPDGSMDFVWESAGDVNDSGWSVEMAIPFASLRFQPVDTVTIGLNLFRRYGKRGTVDSWVLRRRGGECDLCQRGLLLGITGINTRQTIDVQPYVSMSRAGTRSYRADSALHAGQFYRTSVPDAFQMASPRKSVGVDLRYAVTSTTQINVAINPDFSQVEADEEQIRVNQRFAIFFGERRPFFIDGRDVFSNLYYSRAIVDPSAGVRLTTKQGRYAVGLLYAHDADPSFFYYKGHESSGIIEHLGTPAEAVLGRVRREVLEDSYIGLSAIGRRAEGGQSNNGVLTGDLSLRAGLWRITGDAGFSTEQAPLATTERLESLTDSIAETVVTRTVIDTSTTLDGRRREGGYYRMRLGRWGRATNLWIGSDGSSPTFRHQLGQWNRVGVRSFNSGVELRQVASTGFRQQLKESFDASRTEAWGGGMLDSRIGMTLALDIRPRTNMWTALRREQATYLSRTLTTRGVYAEASSSRWRAFSVKIGGGAGERAIFDPANPRVGVGYDANAGVGIQPSDRAAIDMSLRKATQYDNGWSTVATDAKIYRLRSSYQFRRALGLRAIMEYSDQYSSAIQAPFARHTGRVGSSMLLTYELGPTSFLYAGYNDTRQRYDEPVVDHGGLVQTGGMIFFKVSYLMRL